MDNYLPLAEYSSKYQVSMSTLRRRIKAEDIQFKFEDGRYLILDEPTSTHQRRPRPSPSIQSSDEPLVSAQEPVLEVANRLLTELKKAYSQILQEKENQILHLKEEVADLKTLVRVLEAENERLNQDSLR